MSSSSIQQPTINNKTPENNTPQQNSTDIHKAKVGDNPGYQATLALINHEYWSLPICWPDSVGHCACSKKQRHNAQSAGKAPLTNHGVKDSSNKVSQIWEWWHKWPNANIGIDIEKSGLFIIAPDSVEWDEEFKRRGLPPTTTVKSGGGPGHYHYYYRRPKGCPIYRINKPGMYDIQTGGYVIAPNSLHRSGEHYTFEAPLLHVSELPFAPQWAVDMAEAAAGKSMNALPPAIVGPEEPGGLEDPADPADPEDLYEPPEIIMRGSLLGWWDGKMVIDATDGKPKPRGQADRVDRSATLWHIALRMGHAGNSAQAIKRGIADRDVALGYNKFSDRGVEKAKIEYSRIARKVKEAISRGHLHPPGEEYFQEAGFPEEECLTIRTQSATSAPPDLDDATWDIILEEADEQIGLQPDVAGPEEVSSFPDTFSPDDNWVLSEELGTAFSIAMQHSLEKGERRQSIMEQGLPETLSSMRDEAVGDKETMRWQKLYDRCVSCGKFFRKGTCPSMPLLHPGKQPAYQIFCQLFLCPNCRSRILYVHRKMNEKEYKKLFYPTVANIRVDACCQRADQLDDIQKAMMRFFNSRRLKLNRRSDIILYGGLRATRLYEEKGPDGQIYFGLLFTVLLDIQPAPDTEDTEGDEGKMNDLSTQGFDVKSFILGPRREALITYFEGINEWCEKNLGVEGHFLDPVDYKNPQQALDRYYAEAEYPIVFNADGSIPSMMAMKMALNLFKGEKGTKHMNQHFGNLWGRLLDKPPLSAKRCTLCGDPDVVVERDPFPNSELEYDDRGRAFWKPPVEPSDTNVKPLVRKERTDAIKNNKDRAAEKDIEIRNDFEWKRHIARKKREEVKEARAAREAERLERERQANPPP